MGGPALATLHARLRHSNANFMKTPPDIAYYYPAPYWRPHENDWVKSLLLFFDKVSILLPTYMYGRHEAADPSLAGPMEERGLLQVLEPETWVDRKVASQLSGIMTSLLAEGVFDELPAAKRFAALSQSRIGYGADVELADSLVEELKARNLARPSENGVSIPLHPQARTTILVFLSQLLRAAGAERNLCLHPVTSHRQGVADLAATLSRKGMPSHGRFVQLDLEAVSLDLSTVPLDEVLQFRDEHRDLHRAYTRDLRGFLDELGSIALPGDREEALRERGQEIRDAAADLHRNAAREFRRDLGSWSLGMSGALVDGGVLGTVLEVASRVRDQLGKKKEKSPTAYSYLFAAEKQWR